ncbi:MAG: hypothetical protein WC858_06145 [Parcubacteria group bacterium]|jgi:hypothetical protein
MFEESGVVPGKVYANADWKCEEDLTDQEREKMEAAIKCCSNCKGGEDLLWCRECVNFFCSPCRKRKDFDGLFTGWTEYCPQGHKLRVRTWKIG